ncbi:MAG: tRNA (5-methylaminomethyl-2-thiouridine)(34)-methyltransferase MnmD [Pseudomonadales bacterium]|nr:tRNA (5-methylaminomethyl-2-thiouridine)(34)-methyltransferase MnmD [Pseudomonadales bacterium]
MTAPHPRQLAPARLRWTEEGPESLETGDVYFSRRGGAAETRAVFLAGNGLPERFRDRPRLRLGELGFGTGLNFLETRRAFLATAPAGACLDYVAFERAPLAPGDRDRFATFLETCGETGLAAGARLLDERFPAPFAGWHRLVLDGGRVRLSLWLGDAAAGLEDWRAAGVPGGVDGWYLDGFAPRLAPELWAPALFRSLAERSAPGATVATFSVARAVRDALAAAGFAVERVPATTGKRQVLRGRLGAGSGTPAAATPATVLVIGAGLAGACAATALASRGTAVTVLDAAGIARGASGNPWAVLHPRLPLDDGPRAPLLLDAYRFALAWLAGRAGWRPQPVLQFAEPRRPERLARVLERFAGADPRLAARSFAGETTLAFPDAGRADLPALIAAALAEPRIELRRTPVASLGAGGGARAVQLADGTTLEADAVVLAAGTATAALAPALARLGRMRGQLTRVRTDPPGALPVLTGRGHAVPLEDGWVSGSSYVRDGPPGPPTESERRENLARLARWGALLGAEGLAARAEPAEEFTGVRCTVPDRMPVVGLLAPGLAVTTGHASSGLTTCPLAGEWLAAALCGEAPAADGELRTAADPRRLAGA